MLKSLAQIVIDDKLSEIEFEDQGIIKVGSSEWEKYKHKLIEVD